MTLPRWAWRVIGIWVVASLALWAAITAAGIATNQVGWVFKALPLLAAPVIAWVVLVWMTEPDQPAAP